MYVFSRPSGLIVVLALIFPPSFGLLYAESVLVKPRIVIQSPDYNFGTVTEGTKVQNEFVVANAGTGDLRIQRVVPACGCTAVNFSEVVVAAGQQIKIPVEFNSSGFSGQVQKAVRVYSDDPKTPISIVSLRGVVADEVRIEPKSLIFEDANKGLPASLQREFTVSLDQSSKASLKSARSFSKYVTVAEVESNDNVVRFRVQLSPALPFGEFRDRLVLEFNGSKHSAINVPIFAQIKGQVVLEPAALSFGLITGDQPIKRRAKLESSGPEPLRIKELQSSDQAVAAVFSPIKEGHSYWIDVTIDPSMIKRDLRALVTIVTEGASSDGGVSLNVYGVLPPKA